MKKTNKQKYDEALSRATHGMTMSNYPSIFHGFIAKGIPEDQIQPRINVLTYDAWRALGRYVKRGEHGVKVVTFIEVDKKVIDDAGEEKKEHFRRPWSTTVFHISQTEAR